MDKLRYETKTKGTAQIIKGEIPIMSTWQSSRSMHAPPCKLTFSQNIAIEYI